MVSSDRPVSLEDEVSHSMKEMIGGCCVCSDERGWAENPLVYCDGHGCSVAVHQGKHPTARRAEPGLSQPSPLPPPWQQLPVPLPPLPPPRPRPRPHPVPRPGIDSEGRRRGGRGVGCACGRKCVWPGLSCDAALTFSSVIRPPLAPGAVGLRTLGGGGRRRGGVRARARAPRPWPRGCGFGLGRGELPPPPAAPSAAVSGDFLYHGVGLGSAARGAGADRELGGLPCRFRFGGGGEGAGCRTPSFLAETLLPLLRTGASRGEEAEGRRRSRAAAGAAGLSCSGWWMRLLSGRLGPLPQRQ